MKCVMSVDGNHIKRVSDDTASQLYQEGWRYVPKSIWKEKVRDIEKPQEEETSTKKKSNKMSKSQKRHMRKSNK